MIQMGAILAVMWLYRERIINVVLGLFSRPEARRFAIMLLVAFLPAAFGVLLADFVASVLYESPIVFGWAFIIGGIVMLIVERLCRAPVVREADHTPVSRAFGIGLFQTLALVLVCPVPGRRSSASLMRLDRAAAAEFSFFLAMPTMVAALCIVVEVRDHLAPERAGEIAVGFVMAFLAALVVVRPFAFRGPVRVFPVRVVSHCRGAADPGCCRERLAVMGWLRRTFWPASSSPCRS